MKSPEEIMRTYEILEGEIFHICKKAENKCRHSFSGVSHWSPKLKQAIQKLSYWRARLKYNSFHPVIHKLGAKLNIDFHPNDIGEIKSQLQRSDRNW